jgi:Zn-finger nucleic acid-binding protein
MVYRDVHHLCPRCGVALENTAAMGNRFMRCEQCRGAFVDPSTMSRMFNDMGGAAPITYPADVVRTLSCPSCSEPMTRFRISSLDGWVEIDTCQQHGMWFDTRELQLTLEAVGLAALER